MSGPAAHSRARPPRVVWDLQVAGRNPTGIGVYAARLVHHLRRRDDVAVHPLRGWPVPRRRRDPVSRAAGFLADVSWTQLAVPAALARLRGDILHAPAFEAPLRGPGKLVVTVHDTIFHRFPEQYPRLYVAYMRWLVPRVLKRAAVIVANSESTKRDFVEDFRVEPSRIRVIHLGVDHERFNPEAGSRAGAGPARLGLRAGYVLHVGTPVARKNIPLLLEAVALLKARGAWGSRQVVLAGAAPPGLPGLAAVHDAVARLGLAEDVVLAGRVPDEWLPGLYARAAVLASPSTYEGFGLPLVEAMACGTPVVAVAGSAVPEVLGDAGLLVAADASAFAEALLTVLDAPEVRRELRERGLRRAAAFSWELTARRTVEVYREVADS